VACLRKSFRFAAVLTIISGDFWRDPPLSFHGDRDMSESYGRATGSNNVVITGVNIPFGELVGLILKVMLASIPAYIILFIIFGILATVFGGLFAGLIGMGMH
jgi:hypothetical protein